MSKTISDADLNAVSRCIKIDNWIFEVKTVRAIRADEYGKPYSAIATINVNGDRAYVDGLMTNTTIDLERDDFAAFTAFLQQIDVKKVEFDRYKNQERVSKSVTVPEPKKSPLHLVSVG
ncbi:hypothetical protein KO495_11010 [Colwellia sp. D2M02]|uniref:Uncharacterized protein n=1 Tax=Colwellia asteriadis TaxID=517723 RepID=A0ABP3WJZ4_9GAMM|nr:hypothetical protein [Colwellia sp. D2M02]MBU2893852.1 hypothetical protein [Colwellia sp. D2M02]